MSSFYTSHWRYIDSKRAAFCNRDRLSSMRLYTRRAFLSLYTCWQNSKSIKRSCSVSSKIETLAVRSLHSKVSYKVHVMHIRKSVDSLCRNGTDAQYMQYLSKCRITNTLKAYLSTSSSSLSPFMIMQQDSYKCPTATQKTAKRKSMLLQKCLYSSSILRYDHSNNDDSKTVQVLTVILSQN